MDPNEALKRMRELSDELDRFEDDRTRSLIAEDMASVWDGLDRWMTRGGFLPADWDKG